MPFIAAYFNELVSSSTLTPPSCHSARRVYPELQNPLFLKSEGKPSPSREKVPEGRMRGEKEALQRYSLIISKTFSVL